jgi:hypothetical protein
MIAKGHPPCEGGFVLGFWHKLRSVENGVIDRLNLLQYFHTTSYETARDS